MSDAGMKKSEEGPGESRSVVREAFKSVLALLIVLGLVEVGIRLAYRVRSSAIEYVAMPYIMGGDYGPYPPWRETDGMRVNDSELYWRGRPNFRQRYLNIFSPARSQEDRLKVLRSFWPRLPDSMEGSAVWEVRLNSEGFRGEEFVEPKPPGVFRIVCLGDSWTFGASVDQKDVYPSRLEALLRNEFPNRKFDVLNLGIIGHSSHQGRKLVRRAIELDADVVVIGYAMNEDDWAGYEDFEPFQAQARVSLTEQLADLLEEAGEYATEGFELYKLLEYWALRLKWRPDPYEEEILHWAEEVLEAEAIGTDVDQESWLRDSLEDFERNVIEMIERVRGHGGFVVLLYPEFWQQSPHLRMLESVSLAKAVPLVDASRLIAEAQAGVHRSVANRLGLSGKGAEVVEGSEAPVLADLEVVFRVYAASESVPDAVFISGTDPVLGDLIPNSIRMYDDGSHGDQRAGDRVWSLAATLPRGETVFYLYTNSGNEGSWEGLDLPIARRLETGSTAIGAPVYLPIDQFGELPFYGDPWHTDAAGNELIAAAVLAVLRADGPLSAMGRGLTATGDSSGDGTAHEQG